jgi:hypothetical protein
MKSIKPNEIFNLFERNLVNQADLIKSSKRFKSLESVCNEAASHLKQLAKQLVNKTKMNFEWIDSALVKAIAIYLKNKMIFLRQIKN